MAKEITLNYKHKLQQSEAKGKVELFLHDMKGQLGLSYSWIDDNILSFEGVNGLGKGVKGVLKLNDGNVEITADLPMMLKPFKPMMEKQIKDKLQEKLSQ